MSGIRNQIIISACLYVGLILVGYTTSWTGPIIPKLRDLDQSPLPYLLSESEISLIASFMYIGSIPGPYVIGWLSNSKGRKPCLVLGGFISILANVILATSNNIAMLYCGRALAGLGIGTIEVISMVYIGEIASTSIRGVLLTAIGISQTSGAILLYSVVPFFPYHVSTYVSISLAIIFTAGAFLLPESPIYHILKDDEDELVKVLQTLGRLDDRKELRELKDELKGSNYKMDWIELFTLKTNKRALFIVVFMNIFLHISGFTFLSFYSATIFEKSGSSISSNIAMIIIASFQVTGSLAASYFIEKLGRKILLIVSSIVCSVSMCALGIYFYLDSIGEPGIENVKWLPMVILIKFIVGFDFGLGVVPLVLIGEMFTSNARSNGSAVAMTCAWLAGFLVSTVFGSLMETVGGYVMFWFFTGTCACAFLFTIFCIPETKGKSLLEIQQLLNRKKMF